MLVLARFAGPNGVISVVEDLATGARLYREGGVVQSRVLAGGEAGVDYIILMAQLLVGGNVLLLGCGGGALAGMLHRRGRSVTVVDVNPISFQLARVFFWMPDGIECITGDIRDFTRRERRTFGSIGIGVGALVSPMRRFWTAPRSRISDACCAAAGVLQSTSPTR